MKHYKIKLEDKAAFLNKIESVGVEVDSFDIVNNNKSKTNPLSRYKKSVIHPQ